MARDLNQRQLAQVLGISEDLVCVAQREGRITATPGYPPTANIAHFDLTEAKAAMTREIACRGTKGDSLAAINEAIYLANPGIPGSDHGLANAARCF